MRAEIRNHLERFAFLYFIILPEKEELVVKLRTFCAVLIGLACAAGAKGQCPCEGDVNTDGVVNVIDVLRVYECAIGAVPPSDPQCDLADVDCDGIVDTCDMSRVYCFFVGHTDCCGHHTVCGACCSDSGNFQECEFVSEEMCTGLMMVGTYHGDGSECDPMPCECFTNADCIDEDPCTEDLCGPLNTCEHIPMGDGTPCNDGLFCNGEEVCQYGACMSGTPPTCDDDDACTIDSCNEVEDVCVHTPVDCDHDGVCDAPCETAANCPDDCGCTATRDLSEPSLSYCPSVSKTVHITLQVPPGTQAVGVEDVPPNDWTQIENISDGGTYDAENHKVKWGPLFSPFPDELTYDVIAPASAAGVQCFAGTVSVDGANEPVCGDTCIEELCCASLPADDEAPVCEGCADCTCAACGDGRVEMCEMIGYACAWKKGCNDDLSGMTRAAYLWVSGECYCWDEIEQNWFPVSCATWDSPCCSEGPSPKPAKTERVRGITELSPHASVRMISATRESRGPARQTQVSIAVRAPLGTSVMALEYAILKGWKVTAISDGGTWDVQSRKVKWGPFFDDLPRTVSFVVRGPAEATRLTESFGTVSFDGINHPIARE